MTTLWAYQFDLEPQFGQTSWQCAAAAWQLIAARVGEVYSNSGLPVPPLAVGHCEINPLGHHFRITQQQDAAHRLITFDWEVPAENQSLFLWHLSAVLACNIKTVELALVFQVAPRDFLLCERSFQPDLLKTRGILGQLLGQLLRGWPCRIGGQPVPAYARLVAAEHTEVFARETLLSSSRVLPIFMWALDDTTTVTREHIRNFQELMLGLAEMVILADQAAVESLRQVLGPERSCEGGMRIYWPGFALDSPPEGHPFHQWSELEKFTPLNEYFYTGLARLSAINFREGSIIRQARDGLTLLSPPTSRDGEGANKPAESSEIQRQRDEALAKLGQAQSERNEARNELRRIQSEHEAVRLALQDAQRQRDAARAEWQRSVPRLASTEAELKEVRQERERIRKAWDTAQQQVKALRQEAADAQAQLAAAREALADASRATHNPDELFAELELALQENERLRQESETARQRAAELEADLRNTKDNLARLWETPSSTAPAPAPPGPMSERHFDTVVDALRAAALEFADVLVVWEDAIQSAEASLFTSPGKVFHALRAIAEVARAYFQARDGGPPLGPVVEAFRQRVPFKYTGFESQTTLGHFGSERVFHHQGQSRQMQRHLTLGGGQTSNCLQIYFEFDNGGRHALIGYCGRHLPFCRQRT